MLHTMCGPMAIFLWIDRHDVFGIFVRHSFLLGHRNLAAVLLMCPLRIARIWHDLLDQNFAMLAKTIESNTVKVKKKKNRWKLVLYLASMCSTSYDARSENNSITRISNVVRYGTIVSSSFSSSCAIMYADENLLVSNLLGIYDIQCWLSSLQYLHLANQI